MTGLVRGLLAAPVAALVGWLASVGVHVSSDLVVSVITAAVGAVAMAGVHWAEGRWPAVRAVVGWLGREVPAWVPDPPGHNPLTGSSTSVAGGQAARITRTPPDTGPAGPSNVRRVDPNAIITPPPPVTPHVQPGVTVDYPPPGDRPQGTP